MEGTNTFEVVVQGFLSLINWNSHVTALRMHHPVDTLAVDNQANSDSCPNRDIAKRLLDARLGVSLRLRELKLSTHIAVSVDLNLVLAQFELALKVTIDVDVLPVGLRCRRDETIELG